MKNIKSIILTSLLASLIAVTTTVFSADDKATGTSASQMTKDAWITTKVKTALLAEPDVSGFRVHVDTVNGNVALNGTVKNETNVRKAESVAKGIEGVKSVKNNLKIDPNAKFTKEGDVDEKSNTPGSDAWITTKVKSALAADSEIKAYKIHVDTDNSQVRLYGLVNSQAQIQKAEKIAKGIEGVKSVKNNLAVDPNR